MCILKWLLCVWIKYVLSCSFHRAIELYRSNDIPLALIIISTSNSSSNRSNDIPLALDGRHYYINCYTTGLREHWMYICSYYGAVWVVGLYLQVVEHTKFAYSRLKRFKKVQGGYSTHTRGYPCGNSVVCWDKWIGSHAALTLPTHYWHCLVNSSTHEWAEVQVWPAC